MGPEEPASTSAAASAPLTQSRGDIAAWLEQDRAAQSAPGGPRSAGAPQGLAGLALGALADSVLHRPINSATLVQLAADSAQALLRPTAQRHPWALIAVAAVGGAALVAGQRWRWLLRPAVLGGLFTQLAARAATNAHPPDER